MTGIPRIRRAVADDVPALAALKRATFRETFIDGFAIPYPPADRARFEAESYGAQKVAAEIADPTHATWVAEAADGSLIAYAHAGPCKLPHADLRPGEGELYQLYMLKVHQGSGLGRALMDVALDWLAAAMPGRQWLGVWSGNERAQIFYRRFGFAEVGGYEFPVGDHRDQEFIYRREGD